MGGLEVTHSDSVRRIVGVKLTDQHRLETTHKECGTTSLESMVCKRRFSGWHMYCKWMRIACLGRFLIAH